MGREVRRQTAGVFAPLLNPARYKGAWGGRGCVHPDTLIDTPDGRVKVSEFAGGPVYSWYRGRLVIAEATPAYECTVEDLFEVTLSDGRAVVATDQHKFLTRRGWVELSDLSKSDEVVVLRGQAPFSHLRSNSDSDLRGLREDALHCSETPEDFQGYYSECLHQYDQRLRLAEDSGPTSLPSLGDARRHSFHALSRLGGLVFGGICTPSSFSRLRSTSAARAFALAQYCAGLGSHIFGRTSELLLGFSQLLLLFPKTGSPLSPFLGLFQPLAYCGSERSLEQIPQTPHGTSLSGAYGSSSWFGPFDSCGDFTVSSVKSIRNHSRLAYWDLHVFGTNNYLSDGIVNHNSGKSHFFAEQAIWDAVNFPSMAGEGLRMVCIREVQKSLKQSAKRLLEDKLQKFGFGESDGFKVFREVIETPNDGLITFTGMQDHTADSVKSLEGFHRAWVEEAQSLSDRSMTLLRPTIRWENEGLGLQSELWFGWNPSRPTDPVDMLLRGNKLPTGAQVVRANWSDNPWFTKVLEQERRDDLESRPERYGHIWEGEYATVLEGAYYAKHLTDAQLEGRIGFFNRDPLNKIYAVWDIGSTSKKADATAIWIVQFIGAEVRLLDYYEAVGQPFEAHVNWLRKHGYDDAVCVLPHDGVKHDTVYTITPESYLRSQGFPVDTVPNQGTGAAIMRIDAARRMFPNCRFNEDKTQGGREALGWYHEKRDDKRNIGLGPEHDFASHCADAFGLIAVYHEKIKTLQAHNTGPLKRGLKGIA